MKGFFVRIMLVLVFLALIANLVFTAVRGDSFITVESVRVLAFGALVLANLIIAGAGVYFTSRAIQKTDRSSLNWGRRAFVVIGVCSLVLSIHPWLLRRAQLSVEQDIEDTILSLILLGVATAAFAYSFYREYLRASSSRPSRESRRHRRGAKKNGAEQPVDAWEE